MGSHIDYISDILFKHCAGNVLTRQEALDLSRWIAAAKQNEEILKRVGHAATLQEDLKKWMATNKDVDSAWETFRGKMQDEAPVKPVHRIHFLKTAWFRYAAAIVLLFTIGTYLTTTNKKSVDMPASRDRHVQADIAPGRERSTLTLADGRTITLDSVANGQLAQQGGVRIMKLANGRVTYDLKGPATKEIMWNTMSTPRGGQYQVVLPDGTKVWLNAASSITFPTVFVNNKREVKIQGEVYFEVAHDKQKPFIVDIDGKSSIEVLGTSFNVNSYEDEKIIRTTLLEGSLKISGCKQQTIIKPGQQARVDITGIQVISGADLAQATAWKDGIFNFNGADLETVMRQLERWYDIRVQYKGPVSNEVFKGKMYRNVNLSDVLEILKKMDVHVKLEGKDLIIL